MELLGIFIICLCLGLCIGTLLGQWLASRHSDNSLGLKDDN